MSHCPVYSVTHREGGVARGKLALMLESGAHDIAEGTKYRFFLSSCLLCGSCTQGCPNEVDTPLLIQAGRVALADARRTGRIKRWILKWVLPSRRLLPTLLEGARACRALWATKIPKESGLHIRFLRGPDGQRRQVPALAKPFLTKRALPRSHAGAGLRVSVFAGCVSTYMRPAATEAAVKVLQRTGADPIAPTGQTCCGLPAWSAGEAEAARKLARRNLEAFLPPGGPWPDVITTPCASCAHMLKKTLPQVLEDDPELGERAQAFAEKVEPFSRLWSRLRKEPVAKSTEGKPGRTLLTYHDPCHLARGFGEKDAPRQLLDSLPEAKFVELNRPCRCCGHGGSFNISHYDLSLQIAEPKVKDVLETGAKVLVTECSGCLLQLTDALGREDSSVELIYTSEALDRYGGEKN